MALAPIDAASSLARMLPDEILGWAPRDPDGVYDAATLYEYIDGGAEVYLHLDVRRVLGRRYEKDGAPEIIADIFEMGSASDAFGAYHHDFRDDGTAAGIGRESEYESGALAFWKGRFFVSLIALEETAQSHEALLGLGRHVAGAIAAEGSPPALIGLLPAAAAAGRIHFFHTHLSLNRYRFISQDNVLGLSRETEGILARCRPDAGGTAGCVILIVAYPEGADVGAALSGFRRAVAPGMDSTGVAASGDGRWCGARASGRILAGVLSGGSRSEVAAILDEVLDHAKEMP